MQTIAIIGAGNMGSAFARGALHMFSAERMILVDKSTEKLAPFKAVGVKCTEDILQAVAAADVVLLAVKPQSFAELAATLGVHCMEKLVISIMAGVPSQKLVATLGAKRVVRAMPNLAASLRQSVTLWFASETLSQDDRDLVDKLFGSVGLSIPLEKEEQIDELTPVTGSGPAIFAFIAEALIAHAIKAGVEAKQAERMLAQVLTGTGSLLTSTHFESAEGLRKAVTSKGGVTESFLENVAKEDLSGILARALQQASARSRSLSS